MENYSEEFFNKYIEPEIEFRKFDLIENKYLNYCFLKYSPDHTAKLIEKVYTLIRNLKK